MSFDLNTVWFLLIGVLFAGFFFLEGFDYGIGILLPFISDRDTDRRIVINSIGSVWDGNEVWMIGAGGAIFAAFPIWYSTMFGIFYFALVLILVALGLRGVAIEFRSKSKFRRWRAFWDICLFISSAALAILWGVFIGNIIFGFPLVNGVYQGRFIDLLNIYALTSGVLFLAIFAYHGACYLHIKVDKSTSVWYTVNQILPQLHRIASIIFIFFLVLTYFRADLLGNPVSFIIFAIGFTLFIFSGVASVKKPKMAFWMCGLGIIVTTLGVFIHNYPYTLISHLHSDWGLTVYNSSASQYTLRIMAIVAAIFIPIVLIYQALAYYLFRKRISASDIKY